MRKSLHSETAATRTISLEQAALAMGGVGNFREFNSLDTGTFTHLVTSTNIGGPPASSKSGTTQAAGLGGN